MKQEEHQEPQLESESRHIDLGLDRDEQLILQYRELLQKIYDPVVQNSEEAIREQSLRVLDEQIEQFSDDIATVIVAKLLENVVIESGNPLIEKEINLEKRVMVHDVQFQSIETIEKAYPYFRGFDYHKYKIEAIPLERSNLLHYFSAYNSAYLLLEHNVNSFREFDSNLLSQELDVYLEDIARL